MYLCRNLHPELCISLCLICVCIYTCIHRNTGFCCLFLLLSFIPKAILSLPVLCTFLSNFIIQIAFQDYILIQDFDAQEEFFPQLLILSIPPYSPLPFLSPARESRTPTSLPGLMEQLPSRTQEARAFSSLLGPMEPHSSSTPHTCFI